MAKEKYPGTPSNIIEEALLDPEDTRINDDIFNKNFNKPLVIESVNEYVFEQIKKNGSFALKDEKIDRWLKFLSNLPSDSHFFEGETGQKMQQILNYKGLSEVSERLVLNLMNTGRYSDVVHKLENLVGGSHSADEFFAQKLNIPKNKYGNCSHKKVVEAFNRTIMNNLGNLKEDSTRREFLEGYFGLAKKQYEIHKAESVMFKDNYGKMIMRDISESKKLS